VYLSHFFLCFFRQLVFAPFFFTLLYHLGIENLLRAAKSSNNTSMVCGRIRPRWCVWRSVYPCFFGYSDRLPFSRTNVVLLGSNNLCVPRSFAIVQSAQANAASVVRLEFWPCRLKFKKTARFLNLQSVFFCPDHIKRQRMFVYFSF